MSDRVAKPLQIAVWRFFAVEETNAKGAQGLRARVAEIQVTSALFGLVKSTKVIGKCSILVESAPEVIS